MKPHLCLSLCLLLLASVSVAGQTLILESNSDTTQLFINIELEGQPYKMLVDNGASNTILFLSEQKRSPFKKVSENKVTDRFNRESTIYVLRKAKLSIPSIDFNYKGSFASMENKPDRLKENGLDGILGLDILSQINYKINFKTLQLTRIQNNSLENNEDWIALTLFQNQEQLQAIEVQFYSNKKELKTDTFIVDLGYDQIACIQKKDAQKDAEAIELAFRETTLGMKIDTSFIKSVDVIIGDLKIQNLPIAVNSSFESNLLGICFFKASNEIYFDMDSQLLWIRKTNNYRFRFKGEKVQNNRVVAQFILIEELQLPRITIGSLVDDYYYSSPHKILWPPTLFSQK